MVFTGFIATPFRAGVPRRGGSTRWPLRSQKQARLVSTPHHEVLSLDELPAFGSHCLGHLQELLEQGAIDTAWAEQ